MNGAQIIIVVGCALVALLLFLQAFIFLRYFRLWIRALTAGAPVPIMVLIGMSFRRSNADLIVNNLILARHNGVDVSTAEMESAHLQHVDIAKVTLAAVEAKRRGMKLSFRELTEAELAGRLAEKLEMK
jgi:uncharacterized protein YqfA (UPF0365 family)